jgi:nitrous oxidase accessory protein
MIAITVILASLLVSGSPSADLDTSARSTDEISALITDAEEGALVRVPPGRYLGSLAVRKSVVLEGGGAVVIDGGGTGDVVDIFAPNVTIRGFEIRASGATVEREPAGIRAETGPVTIENNVLRDVFFGIDLRSAPGSVIRGNDIEGKPLEVGRRGDGIRLWWSSDCVVEDNVVTGARDAVFWYSENISIQRNVVTHGRYGLHFMYSHHTILEQNALTDNSVGVYLMYSNGITIRDNVLARNRGPSGYGLGLKDCDDLLVEHNDIVSNRVGVYADNVPFSIGSTAQFLENVIAFNESGLAFTTQTDDAVLLGNGFIDNEEQVAVLGRGNLEGNTFTEDGRGNFWSDYAGFDQNGDGVGELPYRAVSLFESLLAREPNLRLFVHSPAQQAIEFTARALPDMRPEPKFVDTAPLMRSPAGAAAPPAAPSLAAMAGVSIVLLAGGLTLVFAGKAGQQR